MAVLVVTGLVVAPIAYVAAPAGATSLGNVLILATSVTGGSSSAEAAAVTADGYTPVVDTGTTWDSLTQSQFSSYSAVILGDPTCSTSASSSVGAAVTDVSTWSPAITGNVVIAGASPVAAASGANPQGASTVTKDAVAYALASGSGKTGLYVSLSCYYSASGSGTSVPVLGGLGTFTVGGGVASSDSGTLNVSVEDGSASFRGLTNAALLGWSASVQETFGSWPSTFQALAVDNSASPSDFTGTDGLTGRPYILVNNASTPASFAGAVGGVIPTAATYGATDAASPGVTDGITTVASGVNPANGDFTNQTTDASAATYGPALSLTRTYDSKLAQAQSITGTSGPFGYGWSSNDTTSLTLHSPTSNDIYTAESGLSHPENETVDSAGNLYIADTGHNRVEELPASSHTQWGIAMTAGILYTVAGSSSGTAGSSGDSGAATSALLSAPTDVAVDSSGDLYIADSANQRVQEVAAASGTQWGASMTANDIYTVLGVSGTSGCSGNGTTGSSADLDTPTGVAVDTTGNLYVADSANNRVLELPKATGTNWGISMTADDEYTVAGQSGGSGGSSGDGSAATSAHLAGPYGVSLDVAGDLLIADSGNDRIQEVPLASGSKWGVSMTANHVYTIAGSASGSSGDTGDGGAATSALLSDPTSSATDAAGDLFITDSANNRIQEAAAVSRTQWGTALTANDIYTVVGSSTGSSGSSGDGGAATSALLASPEGIAFDSTGGMFVSDTTNNSVREVVATSPTVWALSPTPSGITVNQASGAQVTFIPPTSGVCPSPYVGPGTTGTYCAPPYVTATFSYNSGTSTYTLTDHPYTTMTYNASGQFTGESTPGGATLTMAYSTPAPGSGQCPSTATSCDTVTSASGRALVLGLNSAGLITSVTDPLGNKWTYAYTSGNLTTVTDPMSRVTTYSYDSSNTNPTFVHDLLNLTLPNGQSGGSHAGTKLANTYNSAGQIGNQVDQAARTTRFVYTAMNTATGNGDTVVTDADSNESEYLYSTGVLDASVIGYGSSVPSDTFYTLSTSTLLPTAVTDPDGGVTTTAYDGSGNLLTSTDQLGRETTHSYNTFDEVTCSTQPLATSTCSSLSPPSAVSPGGTITPPSSAPAPFATFTLYDTSGNQLWQSTGVYQPGATSTTLVRTTYDLYSGNSVTLGTTHDTCGATPPSTSLPCATIDADANVSQLGYDSSGDVTSSSIPDGNPSELATTTTAFDADGNQTSTTEPAGNLSGANAANYTTTTTYDGDHEALVVTLGGGTGSTITPTVTATYYDPDGNKVATTGALGNPYSASNTSGCNPITTSTCVDTTYNTFDGDNEQTLTEDPSGNETLTCYDGDGNQAETVPAWGVNADSLTPSSCPTSYPSGYSTTALATDATMTTFNAQGKATVVTAPPSTTGGTTRVTTTNVYDPASQLIQTVAPPASGTGGSNQVTTTTYDLAGQTTTTTTGFGTSSSSTSSSCYDPDGDQTATVPGLGNASGVAACGTSSPWTTSSSYQSTSSYDSVGEVVGTVSPPPAGQTANATTSSTYDANGNVLTSTDANGVVTTNTYSPLNKLQSSSTSGATNTNYYDADGNVVATTTPDGNPYSLSNPTGCNPITTSTCLYTTYNTYNSSNELTVSSAPDNEINTYWYDQQGNKIAMTGPGGNPGTCNPTTSTTPCADSVTYVYNSLNQLTCMGQDNSANNTCTSPGSGAGITTYTYTADGQRATMVDATGTTTYTYDSSDRVTQVTNGAGAVVTYAYGQNSDPTCISYPNSSGNTCTSPGSGSGIVTYGYNQANEVTSLSDWAGNNLAYTYNDSGLVTNLSADSGAVGVATGYDSSNNIASIDATASSGSTNLLDLTYTRQANGYIASEVPKVGSTTMGTKSYTYNTENRVTSGPIAGTTGSTSYAYSAGGNMTQSTNNYTTAQYHQLGELCWTLNGSSSNGCSSPPTGATSYTWLKGQLSGISGPSTSESFSWNQAMDTLLCANTSGTSCSTGSPTSTTSVYTYNSDGLRATSALNGTTNNYVWDTTTTTPRDLTDGSWDYLYLPGSNVPVEQVAASGFSPTADLLLADANRNVRGIVQLTSGTHQNQLVNYTDYDAYGNPIAAAGASTEAGGLTVTHTSINSNYVATTPFGFGGGYTDPTGLIYLVNRYYDPVSGQFASIDPLVQQTLQAFQYAEDNPVNNSDPSGACSLWDPFCLIDSVYWQYRFPGWTLSINVSGWARFLWYTDVIDSQALVYPAWWKVISMATPIAPPHVAPLIATTSMFEQFACHWLVVRPIPGRAFNLDVWRPAVPFFTELAAKCNPV